MWFESGHSNRPRCNMAIPEVCISARFSRAVCGIRLSVPYAQATSSLSYFTSDLHYNLRQELIRSSLVSKISYATPCCTPIRLSVPREKPRYFLFLGILV
jgi:hypothetical protein